MLALNVDTGATRYTGYRLPEGVVAPVVTAWKDGWLVAGGDRGTGLREVVDTIEPDGRVARLPHLLPYPLAHAVGVSLSDAVYIFGGLSLDRVEARIIRYPY